MEERLKVLVVDDDPDELLIATDILPDFKLETASSSLEAIRMMMRQNFDAALVDIQLGHELGTDLARRFRTIDPKMAVILHTGYPEESFCDIRDQFDGYIVKSPDGEHLSRVVRNAIALKRLPPEERKRREAVFRLLEPARKETIQDFHMEATFSGELGQSERLLGRWKSDRHPVGWVVYRLKEHGDNRFTVGVASTVGCGRGCRFCMHALKRQIRVLTSDEIIDQVLYSFDSTHAQGVFTNPHLTEAYVNFTCEGEPLANLGNVSRAILRLARLADVEHGIEFNYILTSIGLEEELKTFLDRHMGLPNIKHYWSVTSFRQKVRHELMPGTRHHDFNAVLGLYEKIASKTGENVTASLVFIPGINDSDEEIEAIVRTIGGRPFVVKIQAFMGAPGFEPFPTASQRQLDAFKRKLTREGIACRIRHTIGGAKYGSCGTTVPDLYGGRPKKWLQRQEVYRDGQHTIRAVAKDTSCCF